MLSLSATVRSLVVLALAQAACTENEPHEVFAEIEPLEVTLPEARPGTPPQFQQFRIRNTGADTIYISAAKGLAKGDLADVLEVDLDAFTQVSPGATYPMEVTLDDRTWRWRTGEYTVEFPFEIRYFFSGQAEDQPENPSYTEAPEVISAIRRLQVNFSINCDADGDGFDDVACGGIDCRDDIKAVHPDAIEICDDIDNDCSGAVDDYAIDREPYYLDNDQDGFGDEDTEVLACNPPPRHKTIAGDCDDTKSQINPNQNESLACNDNVDNDCNGLIDEEDPLCF